MAHEAGGQVSRLMLEPACPSKCIVNGIESQIMVTSNSKCLAEFTINACDSQGNRKSNGNDAFFIHVRGASKVRARCQDNEDGTYTCWWRPQVSGTYAVAVSLFGEPVNGSPWTVHVHDPSPFAPKCDVRGDALHRIIARHPSTFEIRFRDRGGRPAQAVDIDVFVVPQGLPGTNADGSPQLSAWDVATHPSVEIKKKTKQTEEEDDPEKILARKFDLKRSRTKQKGKHSKGQSEAEPESAPVAESDAPAPATVVGKPEEEDGYGSSDELLSLKDRMTTRRRTFPIQVLDTHLIVRKDASLTSEQIGQLIPEQSASVIEERLSADGRYVRACVMFEEMMPPPSSPPSSPPASPDGNVSPQLALSLGVDAGQQGGSPTAIAKQASASIAARWKQSEGGVGLSILAQRDEHAAKRLRSETRNGAGKSVVGWATLRKNGKNLVNSRIKLEPWVRQQAILLWKMQALNDKLQLALKTEAALLDPTGVGFAFGGVNPGHLHSKGVIHEAHKVAYSIDRVGRYLLHVRIRQSARPVPGSPFALTVLPGPAHASNTSVNPPSIPLVGEVGFGAADGCSLRMQGYDKVGNPCSEGGSRVTATCTLDGKTVDFGTFTCKDEDDGTYTLLWQSKKSGTFDAKVMINGANVRGSPMKIQLVSTRPNVDKIVLEGEGLEHAIAGEPSTIRMMLKDEFGNAATPGQKWSVGLSIEENRTKKRVSELTAHSDYSGSWGEEQGEYILTYVAQRACHPDLYVWVYPPEQRAEDIAASKALGLHHNQPTAIALPGTPYNLHVTAGQPTALNSYCEPLSITDAKKGGKEGKDRKPQGAAKAMDAKGDDALEVTAGDIISVRVNGVDRFENSATLQEISLTASVKLPNEKIEPVELLSASAARRGVGKKDEAGSSTMYELRFEAVLSGMHQMNILLRDEPLKNSPVIFEVLPSAPTQGVLILPEHPESLPADLDKPSIILLKTCDKYGNACVVGGLRMAGRLLLVKQGITDTAILMPNNHTVDIVDRNDGTYEILVAVAITSTVKVIINMDKDAGNDEMPPVTIGFRDGTTAPPVPLSDAVHEIPPVNI